MSSPEPITNTARYLERMQKSMIDKLFFMDKVHAQSFIDFGCADGTLLKLLHSLFPEHRYLGYDIDDRMTAAAANNLQATGIDVTSHPEALNGYEKDHGDTCLILSSVIHEVYSYGPATVGDFWNQILRDIRPKYIAIRDMSVSQTASRPADPLTVARIRQLADPVMIQQWESVWGSLDENWSMVHFLLKYRYKSNWNRELHENYLPLNKEELLRKFPKEYRPRFIEHYTLPYIRQEVYKDFGIELQERTHLKLIMERTT